MFCGNCSEERLKPEVTSRPERRQKIMRAFLVILVLAITISTGLSQSIGMPVIKWRTIAEGTTSEIKKAENHFLHTSGDIQTWWTKHSGQPPQTVPYKFDPNKEFALAIYLGERKTTGYRIYVETISRSTPATGIIATVELTPPKGSASGATLTQPWVLIAIERPGIQEWQFRKITAEDPMLMMGGGGKCCGCEKCSCGKEMWYDPAPLGKFSIDNSSGVRPLGKVPFAPFDSGNNSEISKEEFFVIQSERQYSDYMAKHRSSERRTQPSGVDWSREQLLAMHLGNRSALGYEIQILGIERTWQGTMNVTYGIKAPTASSSQSRSWQSPFSIVRMSRITEKIVFQRRDDLVRTGKCACGCAKCKH